MVTRREHVAPSGPIKRFWSNGVISLVMADAQCPLL
jgi:hypothetical protein